MTCGQADAPKLWLWSQKNAIPDKKQEIERLTDVNIWWVNKVEVAENRLAARVLAEARRRQFFHAGAAL